MKEAGGWNNLRSLIEVARRSVPEVPPKMPAIGSNERIRLMRDGTVHALGLVLSSVAGLLLVPIMVRGLGAQGYGLWMASGPRSVSSARSTSGLRLIIVRDLAGELRADVPRSIRTMLWLHVALGLIAGSLVALAGTVAAKRLHLSTEAQSVAPMVFLLGAGSCFFDQVFMYVMAVWSGLRRFSLLSPYSVRRVNNPNRIVLVCAGSRPRNSDHRCREPRHCCRERDLWTHADCRRPCPSCDHDLRCRDGSLYASRSALER